MYSVKTLINRAKIPRQTHLIAVSEDGSVREAKEGDTDVVEISAEKDMLPVAIDSPLRTWGAFSLGGYWVAEAFGISQYQVASSAVSAGLSPGATIGAVLLGHFVVSCACAVTGYGASFSLPGQEALLPSPSLSLTWSSPLQQGGQCVQVILQAIWPSFKHFPNHLPESAHVTSSMLLCFFIFYLIQLPLLWIHISKLKYLFAIVIMPFFGFALFGWAVGRAHGFGPVFSKPTNILDGRPAAVVFLSAFTSAIAPKATLALNICDFTRYAKNRKVVVWTNILSLTILVTLCAIFGVVVTSATQIYGVSTWSPLQVSSLMSSRAAQFFSALPWAISILATNISANSTAVGNDLMYITAVLGLVTCPWIIQSTAKTFTAFLGGYSVFLAPLGGVLMSEFLLVRKRRISLPDLFTTNTSVYWYSHGWNFRGVVASVLGIVPCLPGFIRNVNSKLDIPVSDTYVYVCVYPIGVFVGGGIYHLLSTIFPPTPLPTSYSAKQYAGSYDSEEDKEKEAGVAMQSSIVAV
ncbi:hypothetical protein JCM10296v2_003844 [Rhodotorula toruloides]